jgi:hypothetical protein
LSTTFGRDGKARDAAVTLWGFRGPLGAFVVAWGGIAMLTSAPFDDWWHSAYGLDVKIISPPHALLVLGMFAVQLGALILIGGYMNRADAQSRVRYQRLFLYVGAMIVVLVTLFLLEKTDRSDQHTGEFYRDVALALPLFLIGVSRAAPHRWACTIMAGIYSLFMLGLLWILPLFPAEPKLGPVYYKVTHFIPPAFPLLLVVPALALDLLRRSGRALTVGGETLAAGTLFLATFAMVQWPFANFLQSPLARNRLFGSDYFGYYEHPSWLSHQYRFESSGTPGHFWAMILMAWLAALLMTRLGIGLGDWLRRIKR